MVPRGLKAGDAVWVRPTGGSLIHPAHRATVVYAGSSCLPTPGRYYDLESAHDHDRRIWIGSDNYGVWKRGVVDRLGELV